MSSTSKERRIALEKDIELYERLVVFHEKHEKILKVCRPLDPKKYTLWNQSCELAGKLSELYAQRVAELCEKRHCLIVLEIERERASRWGLYPPNS